MREKIKNKERLLHILDSINILLDNKGKYTLADLETDRIIFHGFVKELEIIGEAAYMLTNEFKIEHPETNWEEIVGMRHILVHGYYHINADNIWKTINEDLQPFKSQITEYLKDFNDDNK